jgi:AcrR family transcriptional regulator
MPRTYRLSKRAERQQETRRRIEAATIALHEEIGGGTTITAIAERAGVSRLTVYRHFPDERSLLAACTGTYLAANPPPDPGAWATITDPEVRLRVALAELYPFYRRNQGLLARADQEMPTNPTLTDVLAPYRAAVAAMADVLVPGWTHEGASEPLVRAAAGLAVAFSTWHTLAVEQGLTDFEAATLMFDLVRGAGQPQRSYRIAG